MPVRSGQGLQAVSGGGHTTSMPYSSHGMLSRMPTTIMLHHRQSSCGTRRIPPHNTSCFDTANVRPRRAESARWPWCLVPPRFRCQATVLAVKHLDAAVDILQGEKFSCAPSVSRLSRIFTRRSAGMPAPSSRTVNTTAVLPVVFALHLDAVHAGERPTRARRRFSRRGWIIWLRMESSISSSCHMNFADKAVAEADLLNLHIAFQLFPRSRD